MIKKGGGWDLIPGHCTQGEEEEAGPGTESKVRERAGGGGPGAEGCHSVQEEAEAVRVRLVAALRLLLPPSHLEATIFNFSADSLVCISISK